MLNLLQVQREKLLTTEDKFAKELKSFTDTARRVGFNIQGGFVFSFFSFYMFNKVPNSLETMSRKGEDKTHNFLSF